MSLGKDFTLEHVDTSKLKRAAEALRPLDAASLPKPAFDVNALLALCAKTS